MIDVARRVVVFGDRSIAEGELITLDSNTGRAFDGEVALVTDYPTAWLDKIRKWRQPAGHEKMTATRRSRGK
jgi:hypothetical protein